MLCLLMRSWNTLIASEKSSSQVEVPIVCVTIDRLKESGLIPHDRIDFIKIDTEGAEHMVLQGMKNTIIHHPTPKPWMYIEIGWGRDRKVSLHYPYRLLYHY